MLVLSDFQTSVHRALKEIDPDYMDYPGIIICGSHTPRDVDNLLMIIRQARKTGTPVLGICFGYQLIAIDYARHELGIKDATSEEWGDGTFVVKERPEMKVGWHDSETWWTKYYVDFEIPGLHKAFDDPHIFGAPFHPEYQSYKGSPHELLTNFLDYAKMAM